MCAENGTAVGNDMAVGDESGTTVGARSSTAVGTRSGMKVGAGSDTGVCDSTQKLLTRAKSEKCERPSSGRKWHGSRGRHRHDCRRKKQPGRWHLKWRKSWRWEWQEQHRRRRPNADVANKHADPRSLKGRRRVGSGTAVGAGIAADRRRRKQHGKAVVKSSVAERTAIESVAVATTAADMCMAAPRRGRIRRRRAHFE